MSARDQLGRRRLRRERPLGRPDPAARRRSATSAARSPGSSRSARRTSSPGLDQAVKSLEGTTATRRHIILLTDGWSSSRPVRRDPRPDEGRRDHPLDGRRRRRREPVPRPARQAGRRPLLPGGEPGQHPRHLPEGDPAGRRPADRRGDVPPDPDLAVADPARDRRPAPAPRLQRDDRQGGRPDRPRDGARRPAPRPVAVRPRPVGRLDVRLDRPLGEELDRLDRASRSSSASSCRGRSRARRPAGSRRRS